MMGRKNKVKKPLPPATVVLKTAHGYYAGHRCGARASWRPSFRVKWTQDKEKATGVSDQGATNLRTNLFLMGVIPMIGGASVEPIGQAPCHMTNNLSEERK
jgi:hypothetical protein